MALLFSWPLSFAKLSWTCRAQRSNSRGSQRNRHDVYESDRATHHRGAQQVSGFGRLTPFNGRLVEAKCLFHKRGRFVEVLYRCAGPVSCGASGGVAIAAQRNPFFSSQDIADTDRLLGIGWIDCTTLI